MKIYLTKNYKFRRPRILLAGITASLLGGIPLIYVGIPIVTQTNWLNFKLYLVPGAIYAFLIPALLLSAGLWLVYSWLTNRVKTLEISDEGIRYGSKFQEWKQIKSLSWHYSKRKKPALFYQKKGVSFDYNLILTDPMTEEEIKDLFDSIEKDILPHHIINLRIGQ